MIGTIRRLPLALALLVGLAACGGPGLEETPPPQPAEYPGEEADEGEDVADLVRAAARGTYRVYVANESSDDVSLVAFRPGEGAEVEKTIPVGMRPGDIDGAHGITVAPDGRHWYVTIAHGTPYGTVWKFTTGSDTLVSRAELGRFPATMGVAPDGSMLFTVNFNLHGDPEPSDVSVVHTSSMTELSRITTCVRPHGSRVSADGSKHYSGCVGSDQVVEIDTRTLEVTKRFSVAPGRERTLPRSDRGTPVEVDTTVVEQIEMSPEMQRRCSPTWPEPATGLRANRTIYVACNGNDEILEISTRDWRVTRRFPAEGSPYNLEVTPDGRYLIATLKGDQAVGIYDLDADGTEQVARLETSEPVTHGVVASPDNRYAFVSNESIGATRGTLDVIDLEAMEIVATAELGHQSGGIDFWEIARPGR